jgi:hypothetical protein
MLERSQNEDIFDLAGCGGDYNLGAGEEPRSHLVHLFRFSGERRGLGEDSPNVPQEPGRVTVKPQDSQLPAH